MQTCTLKIKKRGEDLMKSLLSWELPSNKLRGETTIF